MGSIRALLLAGLCLALAGCGYSLRGSDVLSANLPALDLQSPQPNSELARLVRRNLEISAVTLVTGEDESDTPVLMLGSEQFATRPVSVTPQARAAQYELRLAAEVTLSRAGVPLIGPETLLVERSYFEDLDNISGNREELEIITTEMRRDLVNQLMRRLQAIAP